MLFKSLSRRMLQRYWRWTRALTLGVRAIVIDADEHILLVRHTYTAGWHLPGGGVEFGESIEESLARELDEEAGIIMEGAPALVGIYDNRALFPGDHVAIYIVRQWRRNRVPAANMEIAETGFFHPDALPETIVPAARRRIEEMRGRRAREPVW
ncbi:MAG: NUDIX domain-containing protein [Hyphomicrobiaceae bacterium]